MIGARKKCQELGIDLLGDIPLDPRICHDADTGKPTVVASPEGPQAQAFIKTATEMAARIGLTS